MGSVKDWGLEIAQKLFEDKRAAGDIANDYEGDEEWLLAQITSVQENPQMWGYDKNVYWMRRLLNWIVHHFREWKFSNHFLKWLEKGWEGLRKSE